ncbi:hypothetical protein KL864_24545 [Mycolicibacterium goodii]|uniref:hypothetical protein n=1 Tax=Mycolicibacterium goodii TaxID=134601 RepID=UPI001BDD0811|nr:hypothetical protein [Mycolicibacterium goodii]MBU8819067.1 hypothetical protein [Mycolicibacterium goodii]
MTEDRQGECRGDGTDWSAALPAEEREEWRRRANERRRGYPGYRPKTLGGIGNPVGQLGGTEIDGIDYVSDDLLELRIYGMLGLYWTPSHAARDDAAAEQVAAAMREAEQWDDRRRFRLNNVHVQAKVRDTLDAVRAVRALNPDAEEIVAPQIPITLTGPAIPTNARGLIDGRAATPIATSPQWFDPDDPASWYGLFGVVAGKPQRITAFRGGYTPAQWLVEETAPGVGCQWHGPTCLDFTRTGLTFSSGQWIVAVPTCHSCGEWLLQMPREQFFVGWLSA